MKKVSSLVLASVCACLCLFSGCAQATLLPKASSVSDGALSFNSDVYGYWAKTLGGGVVEHILETKAQLEKELQSTRQTMLDLAEAQMQEMLEKLESGEMHLEDNSFEASAVNGTSDGEEQEHRQLGSYLPDSMVMNGRVEIPSAQDVFQGDLANMFTTKPDLKRCTFFGGQEICLPAKRYFVRKSVGFACDLALKKKSPDSPFFECGRPGVTTALCLEWPIEINLGSFVTPVTVPICLPDERTVDAILRVMGGDLLAAVNLLI